MSSQIAISIKNVSKYYKLYKDPKDRLKEALSPFKKIYHQKFYATNNISLDIKKGEVIGIVGKNGSGKSTLLKLITKVLTPDKGSIKIDGKISALLELGSGFNPEFTGLQNIFFYGTILGFSKKEMDEKLEDIISFADIGEFINQSLKTYSSGMKSRLGFAVAVHIEPEILILDEVLSVGDIHFKRKSYAKMEEFFESGKTIIYVSHSSGEVNRLCNRAIMLHDGEILMDGEPKEITKYYEKYLFAKDENKENVLQEIKDLQKIDKSKIELLQNDLDTKKNETVKSRITSMPDCSKNNNLLLQEAHFLEAFVSKNKVEYDNTFLDITNVKVETLDAKKVNMLNTNEKYNFCYTLNFKNNFKNVDFGMQILNEKGVHITGSKNSQSVNFIKDEKVEIKWEFECSMHAGIYYMNIGINHPTIDGERIYINRLVDAYMFRVLPIDNCCNGLVYLKQKTPQIKYI